MSNKALKFLSIVIIAGAAAVAAGTSAHAQGRPDTRAMPCEDARAFVQEQGSAVMTTGPYTYSRIVSGYGLCPAGNYTVAKLAPTQNNPSCHVGYVCMDKVVDKLR